MFKWIPCFDKRLLWKCPSCGLTYIGKSGPFNNAPWFVCAGCGSYNSSVLVVPDRLNLNVDYQLSLFDEL